MQNEFWASVKVFILSLGDLSGLSGVQSTFSIPASKNEHLQGENNKTEVRDENLQENGHYDRHSNS